MARKKKDGRRAKGIYAKKGRLYIVLSQICIKNGKKTYDRKWISTGLTDNAANLSKAITMQKNLTDSGKDNLLIDREITIATYTDLFLEQKKRTVSDTTYAGYMNRCKKIKEYFQTFKIKDLTQVQVERFLDYQLTSNHIQARTVKDIKVLLGSIIEQAVRDGLISRNPVKEATINKSLVLEHAKTTDTDEEFFSYEEALNFLSIVESHPLYELFFVTLFFGLRREEVLGLRWSCIDSERKEFTINHTVTKGTKVNRLNATKTKTSRRTYPLTEEQIEMFRHLKEEEEKNRSLFGRSYQDNDYIFKHEDGSLYYPDYPTKAFGKVIKKNPQLPQLITFHGLRSSCVSILIHEGFDVKRIQKWVGHADIETTLKIYAKVKDKEAKQEILNGMNNLIQPKTYKDETT